MRAEPPVNAGVLYAVAGYVLWGVFPVYFKALAAVPALQILAHRMVWSLVFCALLLVVLHRWRWLSGAARQPRLLLTFIASAMLVSVNWGVYIWAVNTGHVIDASLGYFINPLVVVAIGAAVLKERLRHAQWAAVALATAGVAWLTWDAGRPPWIGLTLAVSFALYGLLRRKAPLGAIEGLTVETALLFPAALAYLAWLAVQGQNFFVDAPATTQWLLAAAGPITAVPLLLFAAGARRITFAQLGILQYISPSLQLLLGVWLYNEPFAPSKVIGYALIWIALAFFSFDGLWRMQRDRLAARAAS